MSGLKSFNKLYVILIAIIFSSIALFAIVFDEDKFDTSAEGWSGNGVSYNATNQSIRIASNSTATKTFSLGSAGAGADVKLTLRATKIGGWYNSFFDLLSPDTIKISVNNAIKYDSDNDGIITINFKAASNGDVKVDIKASTNRSVEVLEIDDVVLEYTPVMQAVSERSFAKQTSFNLMGNMKVIGNTVLCPKINGQCTNSANNVSNADEDLKYVNVDSAFGTFNSSSATINDTNIARPENAKIKWAGLYWSGYVYNADKIDDNIKLKSSSGLSATITPTNLGYKRNLVEDTSGFFTTTLARYSYANFANVTEYLKEKNPNATYTVADIPSEEGKSRSSYIDDGLGNSGAWTLVVIYENDSPNEKTRNMTVFDGFKVIELAGTKEVDITVNGFKTPKNGNVDSTLSVFANEGDKYIKGDYFQITSQNGVTAKLPNEVNFFDSSITGVDTRNPKIGNNNGIDIHTNQVGKGSGGIDVLGNNEKSATIRLATDQDPDVPKDSDTYFPIMIAFSTELYMPTMCYDYSVTDEHGMQIPLDSSEPRQYRADDATKLRTKVFLRSEEGDFDFLNSSLEVQWKDIEPSNPNPSPRLSSDPDDAPSVQEPGQYSYGTAKFINDSPPKFSIGTGATTSNTGGTITRLNSVYAKTAHKVENQSNHLLQMDLVANLSLALDENDANNLTPVVLSTANGTLKQCEGTQIYSPRWMSFNIEKGGALLGDYRIETQVSGKPFHIQVVSLDADRKTLKQTNGELAMAIEMFEVPSFRSNEDDPAVAKYDTICEDSSSALPWSDGKPRFIKFNNTDKEIIDINNQRASRNTALRVWVLETQPNLADLTRVIKKNACMDTDTGCFKTLYANDIVYKNDARLSQDCTKTGLNDLDCYNALKKYWGSPVCSRDNFAIRPNGMYLEPRAKGRTITPEGRIADNSKTITSLNPESIVLLANNTKYKLYSHGTIYNKPLDEPALGYINNKIKSGLVASPLFAESDLLKQNAFIGLMFDSTTGKDNTSCENKSSQNIDKQNNLKIPDVGKYKILAVDNDWTLVDQVRYEHKPKFAFDGNVKVTDCVPENDEPMNLDNKPGCAISSMFKLEQFKPVETRAIPTTVIPNSFDMSTLTLDSSPSADKRWLYMNGITDANKNNSPSLKYKGKIRAVNDSGSTTQNFTKDCAASPVNINFNYSDIDTSTDKISNRNTSNAKAWNTVGAANPDIGLNSVITYSNNSVSTNVASSVQDLTSNQTTSPIVIPADAFINSSPDTNGVLGANAGAVDIDITFNIERVADRLMAPIEILFSNLIAQITGIKAVDGDSETSTTGTFLHTGDTKQDATGTSIIGKSYAFIYGAIYTPLMNSNPARTITALSENIVLSVVGYCNDTPAGNCNKYSKAPYSIFESTKPNDVANGDSKPIAPIAPNWYRMVAHDKDNDGKINTLASNIALATIDGLASKSDVLFDGTNIGETRNITLRYPMNSRDQLVRYTITPNLWLAHKIATAGSGTNPLFFINWINPRFVWTGKGARVGNAVNMTPQPSTKRLSW